MPDLRTSPAAAVLVERRHKIAQRIRHRAPAPRGPPPKDRGQIEQRVGHPLWSRRLAIAEVVRVAVLAWPRRRAARFQAAPGPVLRGSRRRGGHRSFDPARQPVGFQPRSRCFSGSRNQQHVGKLPAGAIRDRLGEQARSTNQMVVRYRNHRAAMARPSKSDLKCRAVKRGRYRAA